VQIITSSSQRSMLTTVKIGSSRHQKRISQIFGLTASIFQATTRNFTKDMALSEHGRGASRHGKCEVASSGTVSEVISESKEASGSNPWRRKMIEKQYEKSELRTSQWSYLTQMFGPALFLFHHLILASWHSRVLRFCLHIFALFFSAMVILLP
jgi:hypothetical protein